MGKIAVCFVLVLIAVFGVSVDAQDTAPVAPQQPLQSQDTAQALYNDWRPAGYDGGCLRNAQLTNEFVQTLFGVDIARLSTEDGAHIYAGTPVTMNLADVTLPNDVALAASTWFVFDMSSQQVTQGPASVTAQNFVLFNSSCYESGLTTDTIQGVVEHLLSGRTCRFAAEINQVVMNEAVSIPGDQFGPMEGVMTDEDCTLFYGPGHKRVIIPVGAIATIHPWGTNEVHQWEDDDQAHMWLGDGSTVLEPYRITIRWPEGFKFDDAIHDYCELWYKEYADGMLNDRPFSVAQGNLTECVFDRERVEYYMHLQDPTAFIPEGHVVARSLPVINSLVELQAAYAEERQIVIGGESQPDASFRSS